MKIHRFQQQTEEWYNIKLGKVTGTVLDDILGTPKAREGCFYEILGERLTPRVDMENIQESALNRGNRLETPAIKAFEYVTGKKVERVGFVAHDEYPNIGYSPDGIIGETEDVEVKAPQIKNYMKIVLTNEVPKEYRAQIIQAFVVNPKLEKRYFVAYNPDVETYPIHIIEVTRESLQEEIAEAFEAEKKFLAEIDEALNRFNK